MSRLPCGRLALAALLLAVGVPSSFDPSRAESRDEVSYRSSSSVDAVAAPVQLPAAALAPHLSDEIGVPSMSSGGTLESELEPYAPPPTVAALEAPAPAAPWPTEPFGIKLLALVDGGVQNKWRAVKNALPREHAILMRCRAQAASCSPAATRLLAVIDRAQARDGWARIAELNRTVNLDIKPVDDMTQYGVEDLWATPLMAFSSNAGDCEDYAIAKYFALQEMGFGRDDLRLLIVYSRESREDHAVTAVRYDGRWNILDNRTLEIKADADIRDFNPRFSIDSDGAKYVANSAGRQRVVASLERGKS
jgi:predicted transglutaminase-like cysteine proteinase